MRTRTGGFEEAEYKVPRIAEGQHLKLVCEILRDNGLLDGSSKELTVNV